MEAKTKPIGRPDTQAKRNSEKRFTQIYKALYGNAMFEYVCVPFRGTNMAAGNQQKHLFLSFPTYA